MDEMNVKQISRLIDWLKANGHDGNEAAECIQYIAGTEPPPQNEAQKR